MRNIQTLLIIPYFFLIQISFANSPLSTSPEVGIFDMLNYQEVLEVSLETELNKIITNRRSDEKYPAVFSFTDKVGEEQSWNIKVNLRGRFRRTKCEEMPPLKLNFKKGDLKAKGLSKFDDLKLVTHCVDNEEEAKELLLKEYLAYKLFNHITDESFRVQLLKINYVDVHTKSTKEHWGILIEDTAQMRSRIGGEKAGVEINLTADAYHTDNLKKVALFQYMIGNLDWDIHSIRNVKLVKKGEKLVAVPYDFDFSFFVDAPYLLVNPNFKINKKTDRVYLGFEEDLLEMEEIITHFKSKKRAIYKTIRKFRLLNESTRREIIKYLDSFYYNIDEIRPVPKAKLVQNMEE